jgi:hypothetical protein
MGPSLQGHWACDDAVEADTDTLADPLSAAGAEIVRLSAMPP